MVLFGLFQFEYEFGLTSSRHWRELRFANFFEFFFYHVRSNITTGYRYSISMMSLVLFEWVPHSRFQHELLFSTIQRALEWKMYAKMLTVYRFKYTGHAICAFSHIRASARVELVAVCNILAMYAKYSEIELNSVSSGTFLHTYLLFAKKKARIEKCASKWFEFLCGGWDCIWFRDGVMVCVCERERAYGEEDGWNSKTLWQSGYRTMTRQYAHIWYAVAVQTAYEFIAPKVKVASHGVCGPHQSTNCNCKFKCVKGKNSIEIKENVQKK